jgi:putative flavoprotein involved in K+ transport
MTVRSVERTEVAIIGGGQSGLSVGYRLKQRGVPFVIIEKNARVGDTWRRRWDSLRLFSPARYDGLVGMRFPAPRNHFPTKDEMADFLEEYAKTFALPLRTGVTVERVARNGFGFLIAAGDRQFEASQVVIAMANYQKPLIPAFARRLDPAIVQLHSNEYRNPSQLRPGGVLIVGAGNSGAEIAVELARAGHSVWVAGRVTGHVPFKIESFVGRNILGPIVLKGVFHRVLTLDTPFGRRAKPKGALKGTPLIRTRPKEMADAGITRVPRIVGVHDGVPLATDGQSIAVPNIIWCTGYDPGFSWLDLPIFDDNGHPVHQRGVVEREPGLYFIGLPFLYAMSSSMVQGVARDSEHIANAIVHRYRTPVAEPSVLRATALA